ncbi:MAG: hypothetical protein ACFFC7_17760 [Candidatus Hermodarchaeota archaeon]
MVEFKIYDESRLKEHIKLVLEVTKDWDWKPWYPDEDQLMATYSREGFTPDTRHYAYDGEELVGFISSGVDDVIEGVQFGSFHIPFIKKGYEHLEDELFSKTINTLKERGVEAIRTTTMPGWGPMTKMLEKLGFGEQKLLAMRTIFETKDIDVSNFQEPEQIQIVDIIKDRNLIKETVHSARGLPFEEIDRIIDYYITQDEYYTGVVVNTDLVTSYGMLFKGPKYEGDTIKRAIISMIPIEEVNKQILKEIFLYLVYKAKEMNIDLLWHQPADNVSLDYYSELNLKFEPFYEYVLRLKK